MSVPVKVITWFLLTSALLLTGCATGQYTASPAVAVETHACAATFQSWQQQVEVGDHFDAQTWSPAGFRYLRVNRLLASFSVDELSRAQQKEWLERAHALAVTAWRYEAESMGGNAAQRLPELERCGQAAMARLLADQENWPSLEKPHRCQTAITTWAGCWAVTRWWRRWCAGGLGW